MASFLLAVKPGLLFERRNESDDITSLDDALDQEVNVVWHYAIGVNGETLFGGRFQQFCDEPMTERFIREDRAPVLAAQSHKINLFASVAGRWQTNFLAVERHAERLAQGNEGWRNERRNQRWRPKGTPLRTTTAKATTKATAKATTKVAP